MKKTLLTIAAFALLQISANAQAPAGFNYQGIARTAAGAPMASKTLGIRISIHDGNAAGTTVYQETQTVTTNAYGLYNMVIGAGVAVTGTLSNVSWANGAKFIQVEIDANGGMAYTDLGTSQLQSVPYALAASSAPAPTLTLTGNTLTAGANTVTLPAPTPYTAGTGISVSGTNVISANNLSGDVTGAPNANTVTKIQGTGISSTVPTSGQVLKYNGTAWAGGTDLDAQTLSISGGTLSVSGGNSVTLPAAPTYTGGTGITVTGTSIAANNLSGDVTGAPNANTVTRIQGTGVATGTPSNGQILKYNGTAYAPAADAGVTSTAGLNYIPKVTSAGLTEGNSSIYDLNSRIGVNTTAPQLDFDMVGDSLGVRNAGATWDNIWMHVDGTHASLNANGADLGLMIRVGANGGSLTSATTYNNTASTLDTVMTLLPNGNVGINTMTPKSTMEVVGSFAAAIKNVSFSASVGASYSAGDEHTILVFTSSSVITSTVTLPNAANMKGRIYVIRRIAASGSNPQIVSIASSGGTLNGTNSLTSGGINCVTFQSDGSNWYSINQF